MSWIRITLMRYGFDLSSWCGSGSYLQKKAQTLEKVLKEDHFPYILAWHLQILMGIRIFIWCGCGSGCGSRLPKWCGKLRILADPDLDPQHCKEIIYQRFKLQRVHITYIVISLNGKTLLLVVPLFILCWVACMAYCIYKHVQATEQVYKRL